MGHRVAVVPQKAEASLAALTETETLAPPVVAVVVARDPGPWFDESLAALAAQDYPELSVLVLDVGSGGDVSSRVARVLPNAFVRKLDEDRGYAASSNEVLAMVEGASHFLFCHDDVAPDPDAVHLLMEESFRSNAAVVGPKIVDWHDPSRLLHVGMAVDKGGAVVDRVYAGEIDHGQHDAVQDVFMAPGGCLLVRADLFARIGGFDGAIVAMGEDLDLCWRVQAAGARVVVAPAARVRHLELLAAGQRKLPAGATGGPDVGLQSLQRRHELRSVLANYAPAHLARVIPQLVALSVGEVVVSLAAGHRDRASAVVHAYRWNIRMHRDIAQRRRALSAYRQVPDSQVRRLQLHGSARLTAYLRRAFTYGVRVAHLDIATLHARAGDVSQSTADDGPSSNVTQLIVWGVVVAVLLIGSRQVLGGTLPTVGQFVPLPSVGTMAHRFLSGWQPSGVGMAAPGSPGLAVLCTLGSVLLGSVGMLQKLLVLVCFPLGALGVARLVRSNGSWRGRTVAAVLYLALPVGLDALAVGRWDGLVAYAAAPWIVASLARCGGLPLVARNADPGAAWWDGLAPRVVRLAVLDAIVTALAPTAGMLVLVVGLALAAGSALVGGEQWRREAARTMVSAAASSGLAVVFLAPWSIWALAGSQRWSLFGGLPAAASSGPAWGQLLRFSVGPVGATPLGYAVLVVAAVAVVMGKGERFQWAARGWALAAVGWLLAWAGGRGWLGGVAMPSHVLLAPAAVGIAVAAGQMVATAESDLRGFRFGWRQMAAGLGMLALVASMLPVLGAAGGGRWDLPPSGYSQAVSWMQRLPAAGAFRVLWIGDPRLVPGAAWPLSGGQAFVLGQNGVPDGTGLGAGADPGAAAAVGDAVRLARSGDTVRLGRLLAPYGIRYVVLVKSLAPDSPGFRSAVAGTPSAVLQSALGRQLDLQLVPGEGGYQLYANAAAVPLRGTRSTATASASGPAGGWRPALPGPPSAATYRGRVPAGQLLVAAGPPGSWQLTGPGGRRVAGTPTLRYATRFDGVQGGTVTLRQPGSWLWRAAALAEIVLWLVVAWWLVAGPQLATVVSQRIRAAAASVCRRHGDVGGGPAKEASAPEVVLPEVLR